MSDSDKMRAEFEKWANDRGYSLRPVKGDPEQYWNEETDSVWQVWQDAYAAGRKAEQETIRKLMSMEVIVPLVKLSKQDDDVMMRSKPEGER